MSQAALGTVAVIVLSASVLASTGLLDPLQRAIVDARFAVVRREPGNAVVQVDIDGASVQALGVWPWSRAIHAAVLDKLKALGATDVAFDVDFSSRSSPAGDDAFEAALKRADGSTILAALQQAAATGSPSPAAIESHPLGRFAAHAWEGSVNVTPDPDGRLRWLPRQQAFAAGPLPTIAALMAGEPGSPTAPFMIDYGIDAGHLAHISIVDLLQDKAGAATVRGRKVIIGATALELRDFYHVPRFGFMPGATVQALALESLLQSRALQPTGRVVTFSFSALVLLLVGLGGARLAFLDRLTLCGAVLLAVELTALAWQSLWPVVPVTAALDVGLAEFVFAAVVAEYVERRRKHAASRRRARRLAATLDRVIADNFAGIVVVDQEGLVRAVSAMAARLLGPQVEEATGQRFEAVLPSPLVTLVGDVVALARRDEIAPARMCELRCSGQHGSPMLLECVTTVSDLIEHGSRSTGAQREFAVCLTFQDVTEKHATQARLAEMAHVDFLSGLANRFVLLSALGKRTAPSGTGAAGLLLFDLDRFKLVNDRFGHASGDALIQAAARRLEARTAEGDVVARLGGDEFAVFALRESADDLVALAETLVRSLGGLYEFASFKTSVAVSVGLALDEGQDVKEFMTAADAALYAAKTAGGDRVQLYDAALRTLAEQTQQLEQDLRDALTRGEFSVVYQRQVDVRTSDIVGVEALVRWRHPERGFVSPGLFIPIAERTGLIRPLGAWVLAEACRAAAGWPLPIKVSVNLSAVQLAVPGLAAEIFGILNQTPLEASRLDLELTESLLMENDDGIKSTLSSLRAAGVRISLDDFGTGYSSLSYLRTFPIDKVKIDQSFVRDLESKSSSAIVRAVVGLSRELGFRINAEGVETPEQLEALRHLGCEEVQGYLHGRPEPSAAIAADLDRQWRRLAVAAE